MKRIGLFGFGCVAQGLYEILKKDTSDIEIVRICIKNASKTRGVDASLFTVDPREILDDPGLDAVIELIDDSDSARDIVFETLQRGIPTVSANKKMIAENLSELVRLRATHGTPLLYEGAVAGAIPVLQTLRHYFEGMPFTEIRAILNGSTNFILTRLKQHGVSYDAALREAQELGFAESDPSLDVQGFDPAYKSVILAYHGFGALIQPDHVHRTGIDQLTAYQMQQGRKEYSKVKLVSTIRQKGATVTATVQPEVITSNDPLYPIDDENNAILINGAFSGPQLLVGKGAGSLPTGFAVYQDLKKVLELEKVVV